MRQQLPPDRSALESSRARPISPSGALRSAQNSAHEELRELYELYEVLARAIPSLLLAEFLCV